MAGIVLSIEVDDKGTVKVKQFSDEAKKAFKEMEEGPKRAQGSLGKLQESWVGLTAKIAVATGTVYAISRAFSSFINEAAEAEAIENRLKYALETTGYSWQYAKSAVDQFANSIQETTRFSDEQARQALMDMMMYTKEFEKAQMGAKLAMDMSIRTGQDLGSTSRLIGMAMSGNVEMLGRYIPELRNLDKILGENATMAQKAEYTFKILNEKFSGTAQADLETYTGKVAQMTKAWNDLKKQIGNEFLPVLKETFEWWTKFLKLIKGDDLEKKRKELESYIEWYRYGLKEGFSPEFIEVYKNKIKTTSDELSLLMGNQKKFAEERKKIGKDILPEDLKKVNKALQDELEIRSKIYELTAIPYTFPTEAEEAKMVLRSLEIQKERIDKISEAWNRAKEEGEKYNEVMYAEIEIWNEQAKAYEKKYGMTEDELKARLEYSKLSREAWLQEREATPATIQETLRMKETWQELGNTINSVWSDNVKNIVRGSQTASEAFKNFALSMADVFISSVTKMIANWILFQNVTGTYKSGAGLIGIVGSLFGAKEGAIFQSWKPIATIPSFAEGAIFRQPTLGIIGDNPGHEEAAIPLKGGKIPIEGGKGDSYFVVINANDAKSFDDMVKRNPESILWIIKNFRRFAGTRNTEI